MPKPISFEEVQLDETDLDKDITPKEIVKDEAVEPVVDPVVPPEEVKNEENSDKVNKSEATSKIEDNKKESAGTGDEVKTEDPDPKKEATKKEELTPFHEHPDWKKMQDRLDAAEAKAAELEAKATKPTPVEDPYKEYSNLSPSRAALEVLRAKVSSGEIPKPADQAEVTAVMREIEDDIRGIRRAAKEAELSESTTSVKTNAAKAFNELKIDDPAQKKKIIDQVVTWDREGVTASITPENIDKLVKLASQVMGPVKPATPVQSDESKKTEKDALAAKDKVNAKINKPQASDQKKKKSGPSYEHLKKNDLDSLVAELGEQLN